VGQLQEERLLVEIVFGLAGNFDVSVRLDLWKLGTVLVVVAVGLAAFWADVFHGWLLVWV